MSHLTGYLQYSLDTVLSTLPESFDLISTTAMMGTSDALVLLPEPEQIRDSQLPLQHPFPSLPFP